MAKCNKSNTTRVAKQNTEDGKLSDGFSSMGHQLPGAILVRMKGRLHANMTLIVAVYSADWHPDPFIKYDFAPCERQSPMRERRAVCKDLRF